MPPVRSARVALLTCARGTCSGRPTDPQLLLSAGWDNTVQLWDLRTETTICSLYGPHICGDALDLLGDRLLTG